MAWSFTAHRGSSNNKSSGAVLSVSPNATVPVGAILVAVAVSDNIATGGGQTSTHVVTDFLGNEWRKVREQSNAAAANAGITASIWISRITTALTTSDIVVLGLSAAVTAKAIGLYQYAVAADSGFTYAGADSSEGDNTASPTVTLSNLLSGQYAFFGVVAREGDILGTYVQDADYNDRTAFGTTGGTAATNVSCIVGDRLATLTGDTFAPTLLVPSVDYVSILVAMQETSPKTIKLKSVGLVANGWAINYEINGNLVGRVFQSPADALDQLINNNPINSNGQEEYLLYTAARIWQARDPSLSNFATAIQSKLITADADAFRNAITIQ